MDEQDIRVEAIRLLDCQEGLEETFYVAIKTYIAALSLDRIGVPYCLACEGTVCDICGACHMLDHIWSRSGVQLPPCPLNVEVVSRSQCHAWSAGIGFLRLAESFLATN